MIIPQEIKYPLLVLCGCCLITLLLVNLPQQFASTPGENPIGMGILGLKILIGYIPLIFCGYYFIRIKQDFWFILRLQTILILICCILGIVQYGLLNIGICEGTRGLVGEDLFKATLEARCLVGGALVFSPSQNMIRLPGTFIAPWQWSWFLISGIFFSFATAFNDTSSRWRIHGSISLLTVFINAIISGQKITFALMALFFLILLIINEKLFNIKSTFFIVGFFIVLGITSFIINNQFIREQFQGVWISLNQYNLFFGAGLGRATNATRLFGSTQLIETFYPKIMYEVGLFGVLSFLALVTTLTVICFKKYRSINNINLRGFGASLWAFILLVSFNTYYYPLDLEPIAIYYWFYIGILLRLAEIDKQENLKNEELVQM
ncbi:MAG: hypothetical protein MJK14_23305 [Rivularia sp. ALOHA_DT_140]|nr:hypothetical protein [Rivularia sp. ALOHA_DT_140]